MSRFVAIASLTFFVVAACGKASAAPPPSASAAAPAVVLPIPPREHAPERPPEGWCGETAIQEGLLHLGVWAPQRLINKAGRPAHPDLYSTDIPVALSELGVRYTTYPGGRDFDAFAAWIRAAVDAGDPVLAGVKILPTKHPEWGLDHFVLVVGYGGRADEGGSKRLLVNTTWGHREWVSDTTTPGLSFAKAGYAIRLSGLTMMHEPSRAARLSVREESDTTIKVHLVCTGLEKGGSYTIERRRSGVDAKPLWSEDAVAAFDRIERDVTVEADRASFFRCVPRRQ
jgi:hypothetical protein